MNKQDFLTLNNQEVLAEAFRLRTFYPLKRHTRFSSELSIESKTQHIDTVASHIFMMHIMADYFLVLEDPDHTLDRARVYDMIRYHEIDEIEAGDTIFFKKDQKKKVEDFVLAKELIAKLPENLRERAWQAYEEFEAGKTPEAKFTKAIDLLEPVFELMGELEMQTLRRCDTTKKRALRRVDPCKEYASMHRFVEVIVEYLDEEDAFADARL